MLAQSAATTVVALGILAAAAVVMAASLVVRLHVLPTGVDAVRDGVSAYALTRWGALYRAQVRASGLSAALVVAGCLLVGLGGPLGVGALVAYAVARLAIARYPTDPPGTVELSSTGRTHGLLAAAAFLAIGVAAPAVGLRGGWDVAGEPARSAITGLSAAVPAAVLATLAAGGQPRLRPWFGLVERSIYLTAFGWLFAVAIGLVAIARA